jgi:hypothetical protein
MVLLPVSHLPNTELQSREVGTKDTSFLRNAGVILGGIAVGVIIFFSVGKYRQRKIDREVAPDSS